MTDTDIPLLDNHTGPVPGTFLPQPPVPLPVYEQIPQIADQQAVASVQIPTGGYAQRVTRIPLPQFALEGLPEPWVEIRNPGLMAPEILEEIGKGLSGVKPDADGEPSVDDEQLVWTTMIRLMRGWCMWDATSEDDVPPLLDSKVTVGLLRKAPMGVIKALMKAFQELQNPQ